MPIASVVYNYFGLGSNGALKTGFLPAANSIRNGSQGLVTNSNPEGILTGTQVVVSDAKGKLSFHENGQKKKQKKTRSIRRTQTPSRL